MLIFLCFFIRYTISPFKRIADVSSKIDTVMYSMLSVLWELGIAFLEFLEYCINSILYNFHKLVVL